MFCPNCGTNMTLAQKFCRGCGLRLERIAEELALQLPTQTAHSLTLRRARFHEKAGLVTISVFGLIVLALIIYLIAFGANFKGLQMLSAILLSVMFACGLLSVFFFNYATHLREKTQSPGFGENELKPAAENYLLEEKPFQPASVVENTTELLFVEKSKTTDELA